MRILIIHLACYTLLFSACSNSSKAPGHTDSRVKVPRTLSDKLLAIAAAIPLPKDSAGTFFSTLFQPADSLQITTDQYSKIFTGKSFQLEVNKMDDTVTQVTIWPTKEGGLPVSLQELAGKMDSAWQELPMGPFPVKDPILGVVGYYTDPQHSRKKFTLFGPDYHNLAAAAEIRRIWISSLPADR
ncbi:hypothetical protein CK934_25785 [Chitinophaga sp. MD30]|nr:hypothetical protein CK934_25785 [Chitinophaga sp. MD30]